MFSVKTLRMMSQCHVMLWFFYKFNEKCFPQDLAGHIVHRTHIGILCESSPITAFAINNNKKVWRQETENRMKVIFNWLGWQAGRRTFRTLILAYFNVEYARNRNIMCAGSSALTPALLKRSDGSRFAFVRELFAKWHTKTQKRKTLAQLFHVCSFVILYMCVCASVCACEHVRVRRKRPTQINLHL